MKRNIISAIIMGVVLFSTPVYAEFSIPARVTTDLNVRQYPSSDAKIINVLPEGAVIEALDSGNPNWNKVNFGDYVGYVYNAYLQEADDTTTFKTQVASPITAPEVKSPKKLTRVIALDDFKYAGVVNWNGWSWTYYTMNMFPGSTSTPCPGRYVNEDGFVCDPDGYIILASADLSPYTEVETPFGYMGKVYDTGCPSGILDVYTNW